MSLHFIGIRDFPVLHRQFSSPTSKILDSPTSTKDLARDSKDVLVQRLNDLTNSLMNEEDLKDDDITALHVDVDRMERVTRKQSSIPSDDSIHEGRSSTSMTMTRDHEEDVFWAPFSPSRNVNMCLPISPIRTSHFGFQNALEMSPKKVALLAREAESLLAQLSKGVTELQARREESNHIHDLLVTRAERAAQRIIDLESHIKDLDADFEACQSELSFLRLQLRALEVQGLQYIPFGADDELSESIKNWKRDWADIDQRTKSRRIKCKDVVAGFEESPTVVNGPR